MAWQGQRQAIYGGLALVSLAVLLLEITLTRLFSVAIWYHFAFMVVSIALLGFGASGTLVSLTRARLTKDLGRSLAVSALLFALGTVLSLGVLAVVPFDPFQLPISPRRQLLYLAIYYGALTLPFLAAGTAIALLLTQASRRVGRLYAADLGGAGLGCLLVVGALPIVGAQGTVVLAAALGALAALLFIWRRPGRLRLVAAASASGLLVLTPFAQQLIDVHIPGSKSLSAFVRGNNKPEYTAWNSYSRVDAIRYEPHGQVWGLDPRYGSEVPPQLWLAIDADAGTGITQWNGDPASLRYLERVPTSLPYQVLEQPNTLVIGAGGGPDVLAALYFGAPRVTGVELNPTIIDLVKQRYADWAGRLYQDPRVRIEWGEGRSYVSRSPERYDLIQLSLVDTWAAVSSGAYSLAENYLYTREAFADYVDHLTPNGALSISRWYDSPPLETLRVVNTAAQVLRERGVADPGQHVAIVRKGNLATTLVKRSPFTPAELERIAAFAQRNLFELVYAPGLASAGVEVAALLQGRGAANATPDGRYHIAPATDDNPFFFQFFRIGQFDLGLLGSSTTQFTAPAILLAVLAQALLFGLVLIVLPLMVRRGPLARSPGKGQVLIYFSALGVGYLVIEIALMQKLALFLGHPVYSTAVVLCGLLVASGLGSLLSERWRGNPRPALIVGILALAGLVWALTLALGPLLDGLLWLPTPARIGVTLLLLLAPLGLAMGLPFPLGVRLLDGVAPRLLPWAWAINGCASVVGPVLAVILAMAAGFNVALGAAGFVYLVGLAAVVALRAPTSVAR